MARPEGTIRVCLVGACGRMGMEAARALAKAPGLELSAAIDRSHCSEPLRQFAGPTVPDLEVEQKLGAALERTGCHVMVDFTHPGVAADHALTAIRHGVAPVIGTSGIASAGLNDIKHACQEASVPGMIVPNFAFGAVLMMKFCEMASKWLPDAEVIEMHHDQKVDAPSGTAMRTAEVIAASRARARRALPNEIIKADGARGANVAGIKVHSVRLPGLVAHQMVMFGGSGETLTIRHDSIERSSFMPGLVLCVNEVWNLEGLTIGMDRLMT